MKYKMLEKREKKLVQNHRCCSCEVENCSFPFFFSNAHIFSLASFENKVTIRQWYSNGVKIRLNDIFVSFYCFKWHVHKYYSGRSWHTAVLYFVTREGNDQETKMTRDDEGIHIKNTSFMMYRCLKRRKEKVSNNINYK